MVLSVQRDPAYTTILTVLRRLAAKGLVLQDRDERAHCYTPLHGPDGLVAALMVDALDYVADAIRREAALACFVERVGSTEARTLRCALAQRDAKHVVPARLGGGGTS
jgi:BlaI family transcriptional regulator, penicillinase repressor